MNVLQIKQEDMKLIMKLELLEDAILPVRHVMEKEMNLIIIAYHAYQVSTFKKMKLPVKINVLII